MHKTPLFNEGLFPTRPEYSFLSEALKTRHAKGHTSLFSVTSL